MARHQRKKNVKICELVSAFCNTVEMTGKLLTTRCLGAGDTWVILNCFKVYHNFKQLEYANNVLIWHVVRTWICVVD